MSRTIGIDDQVRDWLASLAREDETYNQVLRRLFVIDSDADSGAVPSDQVAPDAADTATDAADAPTP